MAAGPCDWPLDVSQCCDDLTGVPDETIDAAVSQASALMTRLSGYTIGQCAETIRPLGQCPKCRDWCCGGADGIRLFAKDAKPITAVSRVRIGPTIIPAGTWRFDEQLQMLWRVPNNTWPKRDNRWEEAGTGEAFAVDVITGAEPDAYARGVGTLLACELLKSCLDRKCRLPKNATTVSAQGITITLSDQDLKTLLPEVAGWTKLVNPYNATLPGRVFSPDLASRYLGSGGGCCGR